MPDGLPNSEFIDAQKNDSECNAAIMYLSNKRNFDVILMGTLKPFRQNLNLQDGVLKWKDKYVVPDSLKAKILNLCHDHPLSGHYGVQRTMD